LFLSILLLTFEEVFNIFFFAPRAFPACVGSFAILQKKEQKAKKALDNRAEV